MRLRFYAPAVALLLALGLRAGETTPDPAELITRMHAFCAGLKSLACEIDFVRVEKAANRTRETRMHFDVAFQRPNLLSIQMKADDAVTYAWICDSTDVFVYMWGAEKYTQNKAPATLGELFASNEAGVVRRALENAFILDRLLKAPPKSSVPLTIDAADVSPGLGYIGLEDLNGEKAQHLRVSWFHDTKSGVTAKPLATRDLWISDSPTPLPLKVEGALSRERAPEWDSATFRVEFKRWLPDVALDPKVFQFDTKTKAKRAKGFLPDIPPHPLMNHAAPAAELELLDGKNTTLAAHKGRDIVVLDFWSLGCTPCIGILPKVDAVAKRFKDRGVAFYAMNENDAGDDVRKFFNSRGFALTATLRNKARNFDAFKVDAMPMMFVIDRSGTIRSVNTVHTDDVAAELSGQLEALLAGRELPKPKNEFEK